MACWFSVHETESFGHGGSESIQLITLVIQTTSEKQHNILLPVEVSSDVTRTGRGLSPKVEKPPQEQKIVRIFSAGTSCRAIF